jgi:CBS-domain-containing membrane protein
MKRFVHRHQTPTPAHISVKAGLGVVLGVGVTAGISHFSGLPLMMVPFGATCVLLFCFPDNPLSQPANVVGGFLVSALIGLSLRMLLPPEWWAVALAVGAAAIAMALLRITHPPGGSVPLIVFYNHPGWDFLLFPVLAGSLALVCIAVLVARMRPVTIYPLPRPDGS